MNKKVAIYLLALGTAVRISAIDNCSPQRTCECEYSSRSFNSYRPLFQPVAPEMVSGFRNDRLHAVPDGRQAATQMVLFGSKSMNGEDLARYYFPFCKEALIVAEQIGQNIGQDLLTDHFNIYTRNGTFRSRIMIDPKRNEVGVGLQWYRSFWRNEECGRGFFVNITAPITHVRHDLNFREIVSDTGGGPDESQNTVVVANMTEAMQQASFNFGRISLCELKKTGVADIQARFGYEWLQHEPYHLESWLGIIIPTGNKPNNRFIFEPIVGNNHHFGVSWGNALGFTIWCDESTDRSIRVEYANQGQYLFSNRQCRPVDLVDRPWSRYIQLYRDFEQASLAQQLFVMQSPLAENIATPGINVLTLPLTVRPGFSYNMNSAGIYRCGCLALEGGYNIYVRRSECTKLACCFVERAAVKHPAGEGNTDPARDITGNPFIELCPVLEINELSNYDNNVIRVRDLDLNSATVPGIITHTLYGAFTYDWCYCDDYPAFINFGNSWEFSASNNAALNRWVIWGKIGFSY